MATPDMKLRLKEIRTDIDSMRSDLDALWRDTRYAQSLMEKVKEDLYLIYYIKPSSFTRRLSNHINGI